GPEGDAQQHAGQPWTAVGALASAAKQTPDHTCTMQTGGQSQGQRLPKAPPIRLSAHQHGPSVQRVTSRNSRANGKAKPTHGWVERRTDTARRKTARRCPSTPFMTQEGE